MRENVEKLKKLFALPEKQYQDILKMIIYNATYDTIPVDKPKNIIIGGQPGAGKSVLRRLSSMEVCNNVVVCDVDNFRDYHPLSGEIKRYHEKLYGEITNEYAHRWNNDLCKYCRRKGLNYLLETTFKNGDGMNDTIKAVKEFGYDVEVKLLAVNPALSTIGIYLRYEETKQIRGAGRMVPVDYHDMCFQALTYSIPKVQKASLYDNISIYARNAVVENTNLEKGVAKIAHNPSNPNQIFQQEVNRKWTEPLLEFAREKTERVLSLMEKRNAPRAEISTFKSRLTPELYNTGQKKTRSQHL